MQRQPGCRSDFSWAGPAFFCVHIEIIACFIKDKGRKEDEEEHDKLLCGIICCNSACVIHAVSMGCGRGDDWQCFGLRRTERRLLFGLFFG
jgi:hypothetical protein